MDESGTHQGSPVMSMAGYIFSKEQAHRFSRDWGKDLRRFGLPFAHMTDCALGKGNYKNMSMIERVASEKALIAHTRHRSLFGIAVAIYLNRYNKLFGQGRFDHNPYTFCLGLCVTAINRWAETTRYKGRFAYIFESGHEAAAEAHGVMRGFQQHPNGKYYSSHSFVKKEDAMPLQAADMLSWQYAHFIKRRGEGHIHKRKDFEALLRPVDALSEFGADLINQWRRNMDELDQEILGVLPQYMPDITSAELAWVAGQLKRKS